MRHLPLILLTALSVTLFACPGRSVCGNGKVEAPEVCDDGNTTSGDGCEADCTVKNTGGSGGAGGGSAGTGGGVGGGSSGGAGGGMRMPGCGNGQLDTGETCDDGNQIAGDGCEVNCMAFTATAQVQGCSGINAPAPTMGTCNVTPGDGNKLLTGVVLAPDKTYVGGQVLVDAMGQIACVACDCSANAAAAMATRITCPQGVISPGLINAHDHISFQSKPYVGTDERYEHRHDWRKGHDGHTAINNGGNATNAQIRWAEVRQLMSGTTSVVGATYSVTGNQGLVRNLDTGSVGQLGLNAGASGVDSDTFPLGDSAGVELAMGCAYPAPPTAAGLRMDSSWLPHVAEGIEASAQNEFRCLSQIRGLFTARTSLVHGVGMKAADIGQVAQSGSSLVWSPRSNVSLYGNTASIPVYAKMGTNLALGTDWVISGSMNMLRELRCADDLNRTRFGGVLSDVALWKAATAGGADATSTGMKIGRLANGLVADIAMYRKKSTGFHRSVIDAEPADVVMTMRGGTIVFGDQSLVAAFDTMSKCETLDVCGTSKAVCLQTEVTTPVNATEPGLTLASLTRANMNTYPLFFCSTPMNEPTCVPERAARNVKNMSTTYSSMTSMMDTDGDGIPNGMDNCPGVFNPIRPMDNGVQADADADSQGDVCDVCPLDANTTTCRMFDPNDSDGDGVANAMDNCPADANTAQTDTDLDLKGDVCDACPMSPNMGSLACPASIYQIKTNAIPAGSNVSVGNVLVTAVNANGFFVQTKMGDPGYMGADNSGLFVFKPSSGVNPGDRIDIPQAAINNFFGQLQLNNLNGPDGGINVISTGEMPPAPVVITNPADIATGGARGLALDGVLVQVQNVTVTSVTPDAGVGDRAPINEFVVTGGVRVNDLLYLATPFPSVGQSFSSITGVLELRAGDMKIEPRSAADLASGPAVIAALEPSQVFVREGTSTVLPAPLTVRLTNGDPMDVNIDVTSSGPEVMVGDGGLIVIAANTTTGQIPLSGVTGDAGVTITATLRSSTATASVIVLGANQPAVLTGLTPTTVSAAPGATTRMTLRFDVPVPMDTMVTVTSTPMTGFFSTVPAMVTANTNQLTATFDVTLAPTAMGMGSVTVQAGTQMFTTMFTAAITPTANNLVISEVGVLGAAAADEFVELYNPTNAAVDASGWKLQYKSATGTAWSTLATFGANVSIASHGYFLAGSTVYANRDVAMGSGQGALAAAGGHVRLVDDTGVEIDKLGYGTGNLPEGMVLTPVHGATGSFERKASIASTATTMSAGGTDERAGNGYDTNNNAADFVIRTMRDPQNSSSPVEP